MKYTIFVIIFLKILVTDSIGKDYSEISDYNFINGNNSLILTGHFTGLSSLGDLDDSVKTVTIKNSRNPETTTYHLEKDGKLLKTVKDGTFIGNVTVEYKYKGNKLEKLITNDRILYRVDYVNDNIVKTVNENFDNYTEMDTTYIISDGLLMTSVGRFNEGYTMFLFNKSNRIKYFRSCYFSDTENLCFESENIYHKNLVTKTKINNNGMKYECRIKYEYINKRIVKVINDCDDNSWHTSIDYTFR